MADENNQPRFSLPKEQARPLITTQKTRPQMEGISSRNLLKFLPWVNVNGGFYRVNRRRVVEIRPGKLTFEADENGNPVLVRESLNEIPFLKSVRDHDVLEQLIGSAEYVEFARNELIISADSEPEYFYVIVTGKIAFFKPGEFDGVNLVARKGPGDYFGLIGLNPNDPNFDYNARTTTAGSLFRVPLDRIRELAGQELLDSYIQHLEDLRNRAIANRKGEAKVDMHAGMHDDEPDIPTTFVAYDDSPREYELSSTQTILKIHSKVADLYNSPYNQTEEQLRLTIEELREMQEYEMVNNRQFGLLHNVDFRQRIPTRYGPPTPDDMDELLSKRRKTQFIFAHPRAIAAFTRECTERGIYPENTEIDGKKVVSWRGVPILTCNKIPIENGLTSIIAMRTGEDDQGVVGLYQMGLPEEVEPSMSVRYMGIDEKAIISYLVTNYFSLAVLVPDALGVLEYVQVDSYGVREEEQEQNQK